MRVIKTPHHSRDYHFALHLHIFYAVTRHQCQWLLGKEKAKLLEDPTVESQIGLPTFSADWLSRGLYCLTCNGSPPTSNFTL